MHICDICKRKDDEPEEYGEFRTKSDICVHYYCLLLSTNIPQRGKGNGGILGFLIKDIRVEIKNCAERTCKYCKKPNASIACNVCKKYYHQICGNKNGCVSMFIDEFHSYCHIHVPFKKERKLTRMSKDCWICNEPIGRFSPVKTLRAYCCNNGYVHRSCMRKYALSAGYYLRCLWCGKRDFRDDVRRHGVFVPDREAKWDDNDTIRFEDLHRSYSKCDAEICLCPNGREHVSKKWILKVCIGCGASAIHGKCGGKNFSKESYTCGNCAGILKKNCAAGETRKNTLLTSKAIKDFDDSSKGQPSVEAVHQMSDLPKGQPSVEAVHQISDLPKGRPSVEAVQQILDLPKGQTSVEAVHQISQKAGSSSSSTQTKALVGQTPNAKFVTREMLLLGNGSEIVGTVQVRVDESKKSASNLVCKEADIVAHSSTGWLIKRIFNDIQSEGRELAIDMVDEVVERMKQHLEIYGDVVE